jgi:hypothetical protein
MTNNLIDRYIYATVRHLPSKIQNDVEKELDSLITEMLAERSNSNRPTEQDIKNVLSELGTPEEMALRYSGGERKALISGVYFLMYKRVLTLVLPILAIVLTGLTIIGLLFSGEAQRFSVLLGIGGLADISLILQAIVDVAGVLIQAFAVITIVFAFLDYNKVNIKESDFFDLPEVPDARMKISPSGPIFWMIFSIVTTVLLLGFPQFIGGYFDGIWIPVFNTEVIRSLWFPILLWTLVEVVAEIIKLLEGRYTVRLAIGRVISGILQAVCVVFVFSYSGIVNHEFVEQVSAVGAEMAATGFPFENVLVYPNIGIMVFLLFVIAIEIIEDVVKAVMARYA